MRYQSEKNHTQFKRFSFLENLWKHNPCQLLFSFLLTLPDPSKYLSTALARIRNIILLHGRIWVDGRRLHGVNVRAALEQQPGGMLFDDKLPFPRIVEMLARVGCETQRSLAIRIVGVTPGLGQASI